MNQLVPVKRTAVTREDYVRAAVRAWPGGAIPREESIGVLYAQYIVETGGKACWNFNLGNVKHVDGDGSDYHCLNGVWEGFAGADAERLIASGRALRDDDPGHARQVGAGRQSVVFVPPDPQTRFRAYASLDEGMAAYLELLQGRFAVAWPAVLGGDPVRFAELLHAARYFTAAPEAYAALMRPNWKALVESSTYEELVATMHVGPQTEIEEVDPADASRWDIDALASVALHEATDLLLEDAALEAQRERDARRFDEG